MPLRSVVAIAASAAIVSLGLYHASFVAPRLRAIAVTLGGDGGEAASLAALRALALRLSKDTSERLHSLERAFARESLRIGFVRYNAFRDVGSDQSFTLALVNHAGDGVVVSSIFAREETRTYGKAVRGFVPLQEASPEEEEAIGMARSGNGVVVRA